MNSTVFIIGAGQLGSRHLQAIAICKTPLNIWVIDPSQNSLEIAKERFEQVEGHKNHQISFESKLPIDKIKKIDLTIVATNSKIRKQVILDLSNSFELDYLILEKFLFPQLDDYQIIQELLDQKNIKAYVNCPRRMFESYKEIRSLLNPKEPIRFEVIGNSWDLACNAIHFIDLFNFLKYFENIDWLNFLDQKSQKSKREGYIEFTGSIFGTTSNDDTILLTCFNGQKTNISVRISTPSYRIVVDEYLGEYRIEKVGQEEITQKKEVFKMAYQSQLTNKVVESLMNDRTCELTDYKTSSFMHQTVLKIFIEQYQKNYKGQKGFCPIT